MMSLPDFSECRGQSDAIAMCERAVVAHVRGEPSGLLLVGPPGTGKTMLARRIPSILPDLDDHTARALLAEYEGAGLIERYTPAPRIARPFRAPHHTVSAAALSGVGAAVSRNPMPCVICKKVAAKGQRPEPAHVWHTLPAGPVPRAGELQLARFGVLFLDEVAEFPRAAIGALADALRAMAPAARPLLVAAGTPCACGWHGSGVRVCTCSPATIERMSARIAEIRRQLAIAFEVSVPPLALDALRNGPPGPTSESIRARVALVGGGAS